MDLEQIEKLMLMMRDIGTRRLSIKHGEFELELEMGSVSQSSPSVNPMKAEVEHHRHSVSPVHFAEAPAEAENGLAITSPMVGTFYSSPAPDQPPFLKVGSEVKKGDVVCIIEAMKVMNEVKAEVSGVVSKVFVESGHPVEFGTKLFLVQ